MEENDLIGMEETQIEDQPTFEHETMQQTEGFEIITSMTDYAPYENASELELTTTDEDIYNPHSPESIDDQEEDSFGSGGCDACRSMCIYNTGKGWKSSDYGYSD